MFMLISKFFLRNEHTLTIAILIGGISNILLHSGLQINYSVLRYACIYYVFFGIGLLWKSKVFDGIRLRIDGLMIWAKMVIFIALYYLQESVGFESLNLISGLIGVNFVLLLSKHFENTRGGKMLEYLGIRSMSIYLMHGPILVLVRTVLLKFGYPVLLSSLIMFITGVFASLLIDKYILHMNRVFEYFVLGIKEECN